MREEDPDPVLTVWRVDLVGLAMKQGHRITACPHCSGPEIWSKLRPESHCFRCHAHQIGKAKRVHRLHCDTCRRYFIQQGGLQAKICPKCTRKAEQEAQEKAEVAQALAAGKTRPILRPDLDDI